MKRATLHRSNKQSKPGLRAAGAALVHLIPVTEALPVRTLAEQKTDFTAEGAPPPGQVASAEHGTVPPALPNTAPMSTPPPLPASDPAAGTVESKPMKQAFRDVSRGLKDTDRGAEAGRTYQKLRTGVRPAARPRSGKK